MAGGGGMGGKAMAGGGGVSSGGASSGGASSGGASSGGASSGGASSGGASSGGASSGGANGAGAGGSSTSGFTLTSPEQMDNAQFGIMTYTCNGKGVGQGKNPELDWSGAPAGTKSFAMTFLDVSLTVQTGSMHALGNHWAIWNIPPTVSKMPDQGMGATLSGDFAMAKQTNGYLAPCPSGNDHYEFTIYALGTDTLTVSGTTTGTSGVDSVVKALMSAQVLGTAVLHGVCGPMGTQYKGT
jgi:Raf kinase inhibitor-like YbhB/YbcL family protein